MKNRLDSFNVTSTAPAKLILAGEHAVLYNCPALSLAIQLYTHCQVQFTPAKEHCIQFELNDFALNSQLNAREFENTANAIEQRFSEFNAGKISINQVLQTPIDLIVCSLAIFNKHHHLLTGNWNISINSEIPLGQGLGSSAAVITALLKALENIHQLKLDNSKLLELGKQIESRQHGKSSGLDPATILHGGLIKYQLNQTIELSKCNHFDAWLINTGQPKSSTGEAVIKVKQHAKNSELWQDFKNTSLAIEAALNANDIGSLKKQISHNQALLEQIGVVPEKIKNFIHELQTELNAAAKICGSGAVLGDNAGVVLCFAEQSPEKVCEQYGYQFQKVTIDNQGAHAETLSI